MDAVIYYSNTNQSKTVAEYLAKNASFALFDIFGVCDKVFDTLILVFPVHCQCIPAVIKSFLKELQTKNLFIVATYGKMCCGNALNYIQTHYAHNIIAGAYVPTKHTYINECGFKSFEKLNVILSKISNPTTVRIPRIYKNPFSNFCKNLRGRLGVKMYKDKNCDNCGICTEICNHNAIQNGKTNRNCIRCLKCVENCPKGAISFNLRFPMRLYLKKKKQNELIIYK